MPRKPKPWYFEERNQWFVKLNGRRVLLGDHPKGLRTPKKGKTGWSVPDEIQQAFDGLISSDGQYVPVDGESPFVVNTLFADFLVWTRENRAARTADGYRDFCSSFDEKFGHLPVYQVSSYHVTQWLKDKPTWNSTMRANAITALKRAFNWGVSNMGIKYNPIAGMEKPPRQKRTTVVSEEDFDWLLEQYPDGDVFIDLLIVSWDSGLRPYELKTLTASQLDLANSRAIITADEGAKGGTVRAIYFPTERSLAVLQRLAEQYPEGLLFRNQRGGGWTTDNIKNRFARLYKKTGKKFHHYALRHSYITHKLVAGVDSHVVATLSGHSDTKMLDQVYSHVAQNPEFMLDQAKKGTKK